MVTDVIIYNNNTKENDRIYESAEQYNHVINLQSKKYINL